MGLGIPPLKIEIVLESNAETDRRHGTPTMARFQPLTLGCLIAHRKQQAPERGPYGPGVEGPGLHHVTGCDA